jgi:hypothetical protein
MRDIVVSDTGSLIRDVELDAEAGSGEFGRQQVKYIITGSLLTCNASVLVLFGRRESSG